MTTPFAIQPGPLWPGLANCRYCPRQCGADRLHGGLGYCGIGAEWAVASVCLHQGEEPAVSGPTGICNIFFAHCNLQCRYCQNHQISRNLGPAPGLAPDQVIEQVEKLLDQGVQAVGFVSPSHVLPQMEAIMLTLRQRGRRPVFVFNSNAYDRMEVLRRLEGGLDVYLPDFKYADPSLAAAWSDAGDYPEVARRALLEMYRQKGADLALDGQGQVRSGLIVRHLVLPGQVENTLQCLRFLAEELSPRVHVSLMSQYAPTPAVQGHPDFGRTLLPEEYERVLEEMDRLGMENGWIQQLDSAYHYQPDFEREHPFEV
ncbi:MAG: radical SAM protein [candidate division FCPU426 bacterium]